MFKQIIIATDLSPASSAVVGCLGGLKAFGTEKCLLLQCLGIKDAASTAFSYHTEPLEKLLVEQKEILIGQGFSVEIRTVVGAPRYEVNRIALEEDYSLIVVGSQGQSIVMERVLGGVAYGIIHGARKPVLVIPIEKVEGDSCKPASSCAFAEHIMFVTDFSEAADNAFHHVEQMVATGVRKLTLLHVQDKTRLEKHLKDRLEKFNALDQSRLEGLKEALLKNGSPSIDLQIRYGGPAEEIERVIREKDVQMVVMGTQGRSFSGELFLGSVSHAIARSTLVPLLLVPVKRLPGSQTTP